MPEEGPPPSMNLDIRTYASIKARQYWFVFREWLIDAFEIEQRKTTLSTEVFAGYIHFISCLYILPVIPNQLSAAGYNKDESIQATALATAVGCVVASYITNLPFVIAPPTSVSIYLAVSLQQMGLSREEGDAAVILSGCVLLLIGALRPVLAFISYLIPDCIQASTAAGIGLITALAGAIELGLVVPGKYTIVQMGPITPAIVIATLSTAIIALATHYNYKGAFLSGLIFGTLTWWWVEDQWPEAVGSSPSFSPRTLTITPNVVNLLFNLLFLYILTVNGIARSLSDLANITNKDDSIPRGHWLFIMCGGATILSGYLSGPPILISPETAGGIKAGARTGLSVLVCGALFFLSMFFSPIFSAVPPAGTSPLLLLVGMTLFINTLRIRWHNSPEAVPAFFVLLLIPFTYSILSGVGFGYVLYLLIHLFTGDLLDRSTHIMKELYVKGVSYHNIVRTFRNKKEKLEGVGGGIGGGGGGEEGEEEGGEGEEEERGAGHMDEEMGETVFNPAYSPPEGEGGESQPSDGESSELSLLPPLTRSPSFYREQGGYDSLTPGGAGAGGGAGGLAVGAGAGQGAASGGTSRGRSGSIIDRLQMDLTTGIRSMKA